VKQTIEGETELRSPKSRRAHLDNDDREAVGASPTADPAYVDLDRQELVRAHIIQEESWIRAYWRPGMGWLYMLICFSDFVLFPLLAMIMPAILRNFGVENVAYVPWSSLTLSNGGMIHLAFGAILGVTAWTRGMEKIRSLDRRD
jgi:hypothetical protein